MSFHIECARRANYYSELKELHYDSKTKDDFKQISHYSLQLFCLRHTPFQMAVEAKNKNIKTVQAIFAF